MPALDEDPGTHDPARLTGWHVVAFLGELVLWATAGWAGRALGGDGLAGWLWAAVAVLAVIGIWAVLAAPRSPRRLALAPRLGFILALGAIIGGPLAATGELAGAAVAVASGALVTLAQWRDEH